TRRCQWAPRPTWSPAARPAMAITATAISRWVSYSGLVAIGKAARYIRVYIAAAETAATRVPMPSISATPTPSRPSMNSTSVTGLIERKNSHTPAKGLPPSIEPPRKPLVGEPPLSQEFSVGVEKPSPKVLSRNAHRKVNPTIRRVMPRTVKPQPFFSAPTAVPAAAGTVAVVAVVVVTGDAFRWTIPGRGRVNVTRTE